MLSSQIHVEHLGRIGHDVGRLVDRRLETLAYDIPPSIAGTLAQASREPDSRPSLGCSSRWTRWFKRIWFEASGCH